MTEETNPFETPKTDVQSVSQKVWLIFRPGIWQNELLLLIASAIAAIDLVVFRIGFGEILLGIVYLFSTTFAAIMGSRDCVSEGQPMRIFIVVFLAIFSLPTAYGLVAGTCSSALEEFGLIEYDNIRADTFNEQVLATLISFLSMSGSGLAIFFASYGCMRALSRSYQFEGSPHDIEP